MAELKYDMKRGAQIYRAIGDARLKSWIAAGSVKRGEVVVWRSGLSGWRKPEELEELAPFFKRWEKAQERKKRRQIQARQKRPPTKSIETILIIEDEKDLSSLLSEALTERGYGVTVAATRKEGLAALRTKTPDLVLLDLKLPNGDGMKILPKLQTANPRTVAFVISAYGGEETRAEARNKGASAFIDKPFTVEDVLQQIKKASK